MKVMEGFQYPLPSQTSGQTFQNDGLLAEVLTVKQILRLPQSEQQALQAELIPVFNSGFPAEDDWSYFVRLYFHEPPTSFQRQAILFRDSDKQLVATTIFDRREIVYEGKNVQGIHIIVSAVLPEYQGQGIAKFVGARILQQLQPDVLMTTCAQSAALYSRINILHTYSLPEFEVFPRIERVGGQESIVTFPTRDLDFAIQVFKALYAGFVHDAQGRIDRAVRNLTVLLARKNINLTYPFHPWRRNDRHDPVAAALGLEERDGVLVIFRKITTSNRP
jgi:GNAT superfamily N-acetyltransferase